MATASHAEDHKPPLVPEMPSTPGMVEAVEGRACTVVLALPLNSRPSTPGTTSGPAIEAAEPGDGDILGQATNHHDVDATAPSDALVTGTARQRVAPRVPVLIRPSSAAGMTSTVSCAPGRGRDPAPGSLRQKPHHWRC